MMEEDKQAICDALCKALQLTRAYSDLEEIRYVTDKYHEEHVCLTFKLEHGERDHWYMVTADSGIALIRDIIMRETFRL